MATYWGLGKPDAPLRPSVAPIVALGFVFIKEVSVAVGNSAERMARVLFGFENYSLDRLAFHQESVRELEKLVNGDYWEVDADEGMYVASLDEYELDDELDEEDED